MKKVIIASVLSLMVIGLVACGGSKNDSNEVANISIVDIITDIKVQIAKDFEEEFDENPLGDDGTLSGYIEADLKAENSEDPFSEMLLERAEISLEEFEEGRLLAPMMNVNSDEIIILKATDEKHVESLKAALEREQEVQIGIWSQYLPDQYEKVKKNIIGSKGLYVYFITTDHSSKIESIIDEKLK